MLPSAAEASRRSPVRAQGSSEVSWREKIGFLLTESLMRIRIQLGKRREKYCQLELKHTQPWEGYAHGSAKVPCSFCGRRKYRRITRRAADTKSHGYIKGQVAVGDNNNIAVETWRGVGGNNRARYDDCVPPTTNPASSPVHLTLKKEKYFYIFIDALLAIKMRQHPLTDILIGWYKLKTSDVFSEVTEAEGTSGWCRNGRGGLGWLILRHPEEPV